MDQCCGSGSGRILNFWPDRSGTEINVSDPDLDPDLDPDSNPDSNPEPKLDPKKYEKEHYFQAEIR
jgi:hypothetical protein